MKSHQQNHADSPCANTAKPHSRRKLLNWLWILLAAAGITEISWLAGSIISTRKKRDRTDPKSQIISAGEVEKYEPETVTAIPEGQFYLARLKDGSFLALSRTCTHLGCSLPWDTQSQKFICPCHGSTFDIAGEVLTPPATRGLSSYPLYIENGRIRVDIGISQKHLQNGKPRSVQA